METIQKVLSLIGQLDDSTKMRLVQLLHQQVQTSVQNREPLIQDIRKPKAEKVGFVLTAELVERHDSVLIGFMVFKGNAIVASTAGKHLVI